MFNDLRYALRTLRQNPGFALTAIVSLALAIGANSAIFSLADGILLRPLPVPQPAQVVSVRAQSPSRSFSMVGSTGEMSYPDFADFQQNLGRSDVARQNHPCFPPFSSLRPNACRWSRPAAWET